MVSVSYRSLRLNTKPTAGLLFHIDCHRLAPRPSCAVDNFRLRPCWLGTHYFINYTLFFSFFICSSHPLAPKIILCFSSPTSATPPIPIDFGQTYIPTSSSDVPSQRFILSCVFLCLCCLSLFFQHGSTAKPLPHQDLKDYRLPIGTSRSSHKQLRLNQERR